MTLLLGIDSLPVTVRIGGGEFAVNWQHHIGIRFEELLSRDIPDQTKVALAISLYFDEVPDAPLEDVIDAMLDFYRCGKVETDTDPDTGARLYSFLQDWDYIYAAFMQVYGIDLIAAQDFHWWRFRSMLMALPDDTQFMKVVGYRAVRITPDMPKEQQRFYRKMKRIYALPLSRPKMREESWQDAAKRIHAEKYDA